MTADRPAAMFWAKAEEERREHAAAFVAKSRRRMLDAAGVALDELPEQGRRPLTWLADIDTTTVDGVVELLVAARETGRLEAQRSRPEAQAPADELRARLDALQRGHDEPAVGL